MLSLPTYNAYGLERFQNNKFIVFHKFFLSPYDAFRDVINEAKQNYIRKEFSLSHVLDGNVTFTALDGSI